MKTNIQEIKRLALSGDEKNIRLAYHLAEISGFDLLRWAERGSKIFLRRYLYTYWGTEYCTFFEKILKFDEIIRIRYFI